MIEQRILCDRCMRKMNHMPPAITLVDFEENEMEKHLCTDCRKKLARWMMHGVEERQQEENGEDDSDE